MKKLLIFLFLCVPLIASAQIARISPSLSSYGFLKDSSYVSFDLDTLYLANDSIYITASGDTLILFSDTTFVSGVLNVAGDFTAVLASLSQLSVTRARDDNTGGTETVGYIAGYLSGQSGTGGSAKTYGLTIEGSRLPGTPTLIGDIDDAGLKIRLTNYATTNTAGYTLRGIDASVKNNPAGAFVTNLNGGAISVSTESGGSTTNAIGLSVANNLNGTVTDLSVPLDVRSFRQSAGVPTIEAIARFRNGNTTGTGIATGILIESEAGAPAYIGNAIDMSGATVTGSDLVLSNGATIFNSTTDLLTITEATVDIDGALTASSVISDAVVSGTDITGSGTVQGADLIATNMATTTTTVLTPTTTGQIDTLETTDLATADITVTGDWTFGTINADSINVDTLVAVNIYCDSVYTTKSTAWADYVFEDAYQLQDFSEKMQFVKEFHYLPALGNKSNIVNLANRIEGVVKELEESYLYIEKLERRISELEKAD